ncbi:radical SAM family heme chaperone HemW [Kaistia geumhonensis]|uniref:Heme chaperone HemW n=1 Tax=Kaistia geumhonensis TaxID=410839 RepID=A0ABU0M852_9HYPH|nr:radical SAM family heme chaperone HemW [Kaistia geumhonensis]MCX5477799.1 radical SAM family heme chaperone HemW [Kaistia geumhonensis]MDQ0516990.1 oxygen-independent coproporphyrinogen-3 oxidase [Kaistia geumhonensis]
MVTPADAASDHTPDEPIDPGFGVYVHWPFCASKCPYCDFNSHVRREGVDQVRFAAALVAELKQTAARIGPRRVDSIFLGGGTPSLMDPATVGTVLDAVASVWTLAPDAEITMEANPSSVEAERFRGYRAAGVNRVSLGVQALNDADLRALGRLHSADEALAAVEIARATFPRLSFDLIYARPGQTPALWEAELRAALARASDHLSLYQLTIEPGTMFEKLYEAGKLQIPDEDVAAELFAVTQAVCDEAGRPAYEISNHAAPGAECRHNLVYWRYGEYAGIGPGAHGRLIVDGRRHATATAREPEKWLSRVESWGDGVDTDDVLTPEESADEMLLMGLRLVEGIDLRRYRAIAGRPLDPSRLADLIAHGMVERLGPHRVRATREGAFVLDAVVADLAA